MISMKKSVLSTILLISICSFAQAQLDFSKPGWYYDAKGNKIEGFIDYKSAPITFILFKTAPQGEEVKIPSRDITGLVIGTDTFAVIKKFSAGEYPNYAYMTNGFGQVLEKGKLNLYKVHYPDKGHLGSFSNGFLIQQGTEKPIWVTVDINSFVKQMTKFMSSNAALVERINNKEFSYFKVQELVREYNRSTK
jgi:hypothetical protein